jgi:hypothetical protein
MTASGNIYLKLLQGGEDEGEGGHQHYPQADKGKHLDQEYI